MNGGVKASWSRAHALRRSLNVCLRAIDVNVIAVVVVYSPALLFTSDSASMERLPNEPVPIATTYATLIQRLENRSREEVAKGSVSSDNYGGMTRVLFDRPLPSLLTRASHCAATLAKLRRQPHPDAITARRPRLPHLAIPQQLVDRAIKARTHAFTEYDRMMSELLPLDLVAIQMPSPHIGLDGDCECERELTRTPHGTRASSYMDRAVARLERKNAAAMRESERVRADQQDVAYRALVVDVSGSGGSNNARCSLDVFHVRYGVHMTFHGEL